MTALWVASSEESAGEVEAALAGRVKNHPD